MQSITGQETSEITPDSDSENNGTESPAANPQVAVDDSATSQDTQDEPLKIAQESKPTDNQNIPEWHVHLKKFHDKLNGLLATKENYKLVVLDQSLRSAYARTWNQESRRYFQLTVNARRRLNGSKIGGKTVA